MAPATDSLQKDSYSRYRARKRRGEGDDGCGGGDGGAAAGMKDARGKIARRGFVYRSVGVSPRLTGILMNFAGHPAILPGSRSPTRRASPRIGRRGVFLIELRDSRDYRAHVSIHVEFPPAGNSCPDYPAARAADAPRRPPHARAYISLIIHKYPIFASYDSVGMMRVALLSRRVALAFELRPNSSVDRVGDRGTRNNNRAADDLINCMRMKGMSASRSYIWSE